MADTLITCENVGKKFCRDFKKSLWYGVKDSLADIFRDGKGSTNQRSVSNTNKALQHLRHGEFWANDDISFEVRRGECLALLGRNGAGKTTLLKILNGLIKPDAGQVRIRGSVSALIALGAGFNPILTGRENIVVNGTIMGLSKAQITNSIDDIVAFAGLAEFIDSPVRTYSSGMQVRLGFAIASSVRSDVLIVDEVLAVGDTAFKVACYNRIRDILPSTAVVFVSHNMTDIARVCSSVLVLAKGREVFVGEIAKGIAVYNSENRENEARRLVIHTSHEVSNVQLLKLKYDTKGLSTSLEIAFSFDCIRDLPDHRVRLVLFDEAEIAVGEWDSASKGVYFPIAAGSNVIEARVEQIRLRSGNYRLAVVLADPRNHGYCVNIDQGIEVRIRNEAVGGAAYKI